jgi:hypothetical protein
MAAFLVMAPLLVTVSICLAVRLEGGLGTRPARAVASARGRRCGLRGARAAARPRRGRPPHCQYRNDAARSGPARPAVTRPAYGALPVGSPPSEAPAALPRARPLTAARGQ